MSKQQRKVVVHDSTRTGKDVFPPSDLPGFKAWVDALVERVQEAHREDCSIYWSTEEDYGSHYVTFEVVYWREETDAEEAERLRREEDRVSLEAKRERAEYERLKRKFEA